METGRQTDRERDGQAQNHRQRMTDRQTEMWKGKVY